MKIIFLIVFFLNFVFYGCSSVRESAGVTRKNIDESKIIENPPLVIPPDFNILPPEQLEERNLSNIEKDLAQEILFGLDDNINEKSQEISTMNQILSKAQASEASSLIREEIDKEFAQELKTDGVFQVTWEDEREVLDSIKESERIRNNNFEGQPIGEGEVPIRMETVKKKKKKRFIFF